MSEDSKLAAGLAVADFIRVVRARLLLILVFQLIIISILVWR